jgi:hypothetical protein
MEFDIPPHGRTRSTFLKPGARGTTPALPPVRLVVSVPDSADSRVELHWRPPDPRPDARLVMGEPGRSRDPLHGVTLERMINELVDHFGWNGLGERIRIRCFTHDPSVTSSLRFLRKTPWAREKVEGLYLFMLREKARRTPPRPPA